MKKLFLSIAIIISLQCWGQGTSVKTDTATQRKEQEEANKFVNELITKTSIKDFQQWLYESNIGIKEYEAFTRLYNYFIQQKYATKPKK